MNCADVRTYPDNESNWFLCSFGTLLQITSNYVTADYSRQDSFK